MTPLRRQGAGCAAADSRSAEVKSPLFSTCIVRGRTLSARGEQKLQWGPNFTANKRKSGAFESFAPFGSQIANLFPADVKLKCSVLIEPAGELGSLFPTGVTKQVVGFIVLVDILQSSQGSKNRQLSLSQKTPCDVIRSAH